MSNQQLKYIITIDSKQSGRYAHVAWNVAKCGIYAKHDDSIK